MITDLRRILVAPSKILSRLVSSFELVNLEAKIDELMVNAPLNSNAKVPEELFTASDRKSENSIIRSQYQASMDVIVPWAKQLRFKHSYVDELTNIL